MHTQTHDCPLQTKQSNTKQQLTTTTTDQRHILPFVDRTISQVVNLQNNEMDILASFLGHDIRVHRQYYRLPEQTLQVAKVAKLLLAVDKGEIAPGKRLEDFTVGPEDGMLTMFIFQLVVHVWGCNLLK